MAIKFTNNASTKLGAGITSGATSLSVTSGTGSLFPTLSGGDYFMCTLVDSSGNQEIVKVTARTGDAFTIVRAQESTTARAFPVNAIVEHRFTAGSLSDVFSQVYATDAEAAAGVLTTKSISPASLKYVNDALVVTQDGQFETRFNSVLAGYDRTNKKHKPYTGNLNSIVVNSVYSFAQAAVTNLPAGFEAAAKGIVQTFVHDTAGKTQIVIQTDGTSTRGNSWIRTEVSGTWGAWAGFGGGGAVLSPNVGKYTHSYRNGTAPQGLAASTWTTVTRGTPSIQGTLGATDPGTGALALVIPESGTYSVLASVAVVAPVRGTLVTGIAKNGSLVAAQTYTDVGDDRAVSARWRQELELVAGDVVSISVSCSTAANITQYEPTLQIVRVR